MLNINVRLNFCPKANFCGPFMTLTTIKVIFLIFTIFSQYQWVFYLQLGYFVSLQFTRKSGGKKTFICESLWKKAFSREGLFLWGNVIFPQGKRLSLEKGLFPLHLKSKWIAVRDSTSRRCCSSNCRRPSEEIKG